MQVTVAQRRLTCSLERCLLTRSSSCRAPVYDLVMLLYHNELLLLILSCSSLHGGVIFTAMNIASTFPISIFNARGQGFMSRVLDHLHHDDVGRPMSSES